MTQDRLQDRLRDRLGDRLGFPLRFLEGSGQPPTFTCWQAGFCRGGFCEKPTSVWNLPDSCRSLVGPRPLAGAAALSLRSMARCLPSTWRAAAGVIPAVPLRLLRVAPIVSVVIAARVVAGRRWMGLSTRRALPTSGSVEPGRGANVGSCAVRPSLSRCPAGRWGNGPARGRGRRRDVGLGHR
jgi:hypothetical protein